MAKQDYARHPETAERCAAILGAENTKDLADKVANLKKRPNSSLPETTKWSTLKQNISIACKHVKDIRPSYN